jgi:hypothetical protein
MSRINHKTFFKKRGYGLLYNEVHPVFRNRRVYAVSFPLIGGGAWGVFENKEQLDQYIISRTKNEILGIS